MGDPKVSKICLRSYRFISWDIIANISYFLGRKEKLIGYGQIQHFPLNEFADAKKVRAFLIRFSFIKDW